MEIEIGKKYRLVDWEEGNYVLVIAIHKKHIWGEYPNGDVFTIGRNQDWLPYTEAEPEPVKAWKTFAVQHPKGVGRNLVQFESLEAAENFYKGTEGYTITEITSL